MVAVRTPDDAIRLAKRLSFLMKCLAKEMEIDLDETSADISAEGCSVLTLNAGELVRLAESLRYGQLGEGDEDE